MNYNEMSFVLTNYVKKEFPFLIEVDKFALEGSLRNLDHAYKRFFKNVKLRRKPYGFQGKDFLHKLSHALTANYQMIILEDLNVKGMIKNRKLARHIQDASWEMFKTFVGYKALWRGKTVIFVDRWFPSSKTCLTAIKQIRC